MPQLINWDLLKHPYNWIIVWLMVALAVTGLVYLNRANQGA